MLNLKPACRVHLAPRDIFVTISAHQCTLVPNSYESWPVFVYVRAVGVQSTSSVHVVSCIILQHFTRWRWQRWRWQRWQASRDDDRAWQRGVLQGSRVAIVRFGRCRGGMPQADTHMLTYAHRIGTYLSLQPHRMETVHNCPVEVSACRCGASRFDWVWSSSAAQPLFK